MAKPVKSDQLEMMRASQRAVGWGSPEERLRQLLGKYDGLSDADLLRISNASAKMLAEIRALREANNK